MDETHQIYIFNIISILAGDHSRGRGETCIYC